LILIKIGQWSVCVCLLDCFSWESYLDVRRNPARGAASGESSIVAGECDSVVFVVYEVCFMVRLNGVYGRGGLGWGVGPPASMCCHFGWGTESVLHLEVFSLGVFQLSGSTHLGGEWGAVDGDRWNHEARAGGIK